MRKRTRRPLRANVPNRKHFARIVCSAEGALGRTVMKCVAIETALRERRKLSKARPDFNRTGERKAVYEAIQNGMSNYLEALRHRAVSAGLDCAAIIAQAERALPTSCEMARAARKEAREASPYQPGKPMVDAFGIMPSIPAPEQP